MRFRLMPSCGPSFRSKVANLVAIGSAGLTGPCRSAIFSGSPTEAAKKVTYCLAIGLIEQVSGVSQQPLLGKSYDGPRFLIQVAFLGAGVARGLISLRVALAPTIVGRDSIAVFGF
jgi:hypothetical protein